MGKDGVETVGLFDPYKVVHHHVGITCVVLSPDLRPLRGLAIHVQGNASSSLS